MKQPLKRAFLALGRRASRLFDRPLDRDHVRRIVVIQTGGMGDTLRIFPLLDILAEEFPAASVATLTDQRSSLFRLLPETPRPVRHLFFDFGGGYLDKAKQVRKLRGERFDLVVSTGRGDALVECAILSLLLGARYRLGYDQDGGGFLFTHRMPFRADRSILAQNVELLEAIGIRRTVTGVRLRLPADAVVSVDRLLRARVPGGRRLAAVHPFAASHPEFRAWPEDRVATLLSRLADRRDVTVALLGAPGERAAADRLLAASRADGIIDLVGALDVAETAALLARADCFIGVDSGLLHLATALGKPCVAVFGGTSPAAVLPPEHRCRVVTTSRSLPCQPCCLHHPLWEYRCPRAFECLTSIPADAVERELDAVLAEEARAEERRAHA